MEETKARRGTRPGRAAAALLALTCVLGCEDFVQGNGQFAEERREVGPFDGVAARGGLLAVVTGGGSGHRVVVSGDANGVGLVEVRVAGGMLELAMRNGVEFDPVFPLSVAVTAPAPSRLRVREGAVISASAISGARLEVEGAGAGAVLLEGGGGAILHASLEGPVLLDAREYPVEDAVVDLRDAARAWLRASASIAGRARDASLIQNHGAGVCEVELDGGATCGPP